MSIDLKQFHQVFFEESYEGLDAMEQGLLQISRSSDNDPEIINTIFRAAHSIKGGGGTLGFDDIVSFTHVLETLLDEVREGQRTLTSESIDLLLQSCDALREMVRCLEQEKPIDTRDSQPLLEAFERMLSDAKPGAEQPVNARASSADPLSKQDTALAQTFFNGDELADGGAAVNPGASPLGDSQHWIINFKPEPQILLTGNEPLRIFRELQGLGELKTFANTDNVPEFDQLTVDECFLSWRLELIAETSQEEIESIFDWVMDECDLTISRETVADSEQTTDAESVLDAVTITNPEIASINIESLDTSLVAQGASDAGSLPPKMAEASGAPAVAKSGAAKSDTTQVAASSGSSIRVGIDKVDNLINLVGELVITQSMLSELGNEVDLQNFERLAHGLEQLKQNTRELQESVMRIRMLPISFAFNRFPRMVRDLSVKTGKKINLELAGEQTELDKTVMEQIGDPLVHLVRNAVDHGIEMPEERLAAGKPEAGKVYLNAEHRGGNIVIEISDDGRGMDPAKLLAKARDKGIVGADQELLPNEILELVFEPGFSTAASVSDISGRGVGMDVVRKNIKSLGGRIEIESEIGKGSTFRVHLPLTLAILDGQLVRVGREVYIVPLIAIVESLQIKPELVNQVSGNMTLYRLRDDNVPIIPVYREFNIEADNKELESALLVVVEGDGHKIGLLVDDLLAQQQVVIKSLESNYKRVEGISGATILGDGSVALILDIQGLITRASRPSRKNRTGRAA